MSPVTAQTPSQSAWMTVTVGSSFPSPSVEMVVQLGYEEMGRVELDRYTVDEIELRAVREWDCPWSRFPRCLAVDSVATRAYIE